MELWSIGVLIIGVGALVAAAFAVPALLQLNRTLKAAERFLDDMDVSVKSLVYDEVKPLIKSVNGTMEEVEGLVRNAKEGVAKVDEALAAFKEVGGTVRSVNYILNTKVRGTLIDLVAYMVGIKVGLGTYLKSLKRKEVA